MRLRWGEEKIRGFSSPVKKAEEVNEWPWWPLVIIAVIAAIIALSKIFCL